MVELRFDPRLSSFRVLGFSGEIEPIGHKEIFIRIGSHDYRGWKVPSSATWSPGKAGQTVLVQTCNAWEARGLMVSVLVWVKDLRTGGQWMPQVKWRAKSTFLCSLFCLALKGLSDTHWHWSGVWIIFTQFTSSDVDLRHPHGHTPKQYCTSCLGIS